MNNVVLHVCGLIAFGDTEWRDGAQSMLRCFCCAAAATVIEGRSHSSGWTLFFFLLLLPDGYQPISQYLQLYIPNAEQ